MKSKKFWVPVLLVVFALGAAACGSAKKEAATTAIKAAEDSWNAVKAEVVKYIPDQAKGVDDGIKAAKENFDKGNFDAALETAKVIPDRVKALVAAAAAKKAEMAKAWEEMSGGLPKMLDAIKSRLDILSQSRKLPAGLDKEKLEGAKGGYETAAKMWEEAKAAFAGGNATDALAKGKTVKEKAVEVMTALGMQVPAAAAPAPKG
ncbi:MAG: hypothetical protein A4E67_01753 [Syntrophaceae bacterium PtaB.Bin038]|jgi:hypothetical protein|nr:MAG: hypothetical protein A4E67_01753 [Syntrophaceae bacterium PtaB.Bin038]